MSQKIVKTAYIGKYRSQTENPLSRSTIEVGAARFTPLDLLSSAYNSCMLGTMEYAAKQHNFEIADAISQIEWDLAEDQTRIGAMDIRITFTSDFSEEQRSILETAAKTQCHVGQTLNPLIKKDFVFTYGVAA